MQIPDHADRLAAVEEMLGAFLTKVPEGKVSAFVKRTAEFPTDVLKRACVRVVESVDRTPTVARLRVACGDVRSQMTRPEDDAPGDRDWIDEALDGGVRWWDRKTDEWGVQHFTRDERLAWRRWVQARFAGAWTPNECLDVVKGIRPHDWVPRRVTMLRALPRPAEDSAAGDDGPVYELEPPLEDTDARYLPEPSFVVETIEHPLLTGDE